MAAKIRRMTMTLVTTIILIFLLTFDLTASFDDGTSWNNNNLRWRTILKRYDFGSFLCVLDICNEIVYEDDKWCKIMREDILTVDYVALKLWEENYII